MGKSGPQRAGAGLARAFSRRAALAGAAALALGAMSPAQAQTAVKFTLDWVFQGPTSPFLVALEKGYYKAEGLDVTMIPARARPARSSASPPAPTTSALPM